MALSLSTFACENSDNSTLADKENTETMKIKITFGDNVLTATLYDNATTRSFIEKLPLTLPMMDLYSREMVYRFPDALPAEEASTRGYEVGEIIYYPPLHSFVIMYAQNGEVFNMQSVGRVDSNVQVFDGIGDVDVTFELVNATSIEQVKKNDSQFNIYPNPANGFIEVTAPFESITIIDINGTEMLKTQKNRIDINRLETGTYLLRIETKENELVVRKFVKQ